MDLEDLVLAESEVNKNATRELTPAPDAKNYFFVGI